MSEIEKAFADVKPEGDTDPFKDIPETETPSESHPEKEPETDKPEEGDNTPTEENVPFHKHPRWIERENELKELRERDEARAREIEELKSMQETKSDTSTDSTIPEWFRELYGENAVAWNKYQEHDKTVREEMKREIVAEQEQKVIQAQEETKKWNGWVEDQVKSLETEGLKFDRNELIKVMLDYRPTDENNNFDFRKGYQILEAMKAKEVDPARSNARKELGDRTTKSTNGVKPPKDHMTSNDLRRTSWNEL